MGQVFTASNGLIVEIGPTGGAEIGKAGYRDYTPPAATTALEEFFESRADAKHGRWRWPRNPHLVMYPVRGHDSVLVLHEAAGESATFTRDEAHSAQHAWGLDAARAYFNAHPPVGPEKPAKPWADAEPGDVWVFTINNGEALVANVIRDTFGVRFVSVLGRVINIASTQITEGRRIWPEDAS